MRLSTAILKGSKGRKQANGALLDSEGAVCALGAACYGVGIHPRQGEEFSQALVRRFPILKYVIANTGGEDKDLQTIIASRNDEDEWSFRKIANWLRKLGF